MLIYKPELLTEEEKEISNGLLFEHNSDSFGKYYSACIGIFDIPEIFSLNDIDPFLAWCDKYHHRKHFSAVTSLTVAEHKYEDEGSPENCKRYALFVPLTELNQFWCNTEYNTGKHKKFPIGSTVKQVKTWQKSLLNNLLIPDYFMSAKCLEDLQVDLHDRLIPYTPKLS